MKQNELDQQFMQQAIEQAQLAALAGEVPVGAVLVKDGQVIAKAFNSRSPVMILALMPRC